MSMYYLHRAGETTGPFAEGRLRQMWTAGEIGPDDLVCAHGTEDWIPASIAVPEEMPAAPRKIEVPVGKKKKRPFLLLSWLFFLAGIGLMIALPWMIGLPCGVILILVAISVDRPLWICGGCGNRIEKTSAVCPACGRRI